MTETHSVRQKASFSFGTSDAQLSPLTLPPRSQEVVTFASSSLQGRPDLTGSTCGTQQIPPGASASGGPVEDQGGVSGEMKLFTLLCCVRDGSTNL